MRRLLGSLAVLFLAGGLIAADDAIDFKLLNGKWELAEAKPMMVMILDFNKDMKISATIGEPGKEIKVDGTYQTMEPNKLLIHLKYMGEDIKETLTVKKLNAEELVTEDSKGKAETLRRKK